MKLYLQTFGCRANRYDSEAVRALAVNGGYEIVDDARCADVAVVNTCAVTAEAERDARKAVRRIAGRNQGIRTIVTGCAAALPASAGRLRALPTVQHVIGGSNAADMAAALGVSASAAVAAQSSVRAVLRVQDGCDEHCTFCVTTLARGANRSRPADDLVAEAAVLAQRHSEIVITGIHIGSYGRDRGSSLGALMERLVADVRHVRFRLSSLEATEVDDRLAGLFCDRSSGLAPHLHAPLQSGSDRLLRRMGRHWYSAREYATAVDRLAAKLPAFGLGADVIAGFPGETEEDHRATVTLIERLPFTYLHVFTYSPRPGTAALRLPDQVPPAVAHARSQELRELGQAKAREYRLRRAGGDADLIVVRSGPEREALSEDYLAVRLAESRPRGERFSARLGLEGDSLVTRNSNSG